MKSSYRWVIVACGALMTCVGIGRNVLARGLPAADVGGYRVVAHGHIDRHDSQFSGHGGRGVWLGRASDRLGARMVVMCGALLLGLGVGARESFNLAAAVPAHLWRFGGSRRRRVLCTR